jgi:hypothetical protein
MTHFFFRRILSLCGFLILFPGCSEERHTYELKYGQQLPASVWGNANNIHFDAKYEFDYVGKHFVFTYPEKCSTESCQGTITHEVGKHVVQTYSQWVWMKADSARTVYLIRTALGERFCVDISPYESPARYHDVQTGEVLSEVRPIEILEMQATLCKPDKQSAGYRRAQELQRKYPIPDHMID